LNTKQVYQSFTFLTRPISKTRTYPRGEREKKEKEREKKERREEREREKREDEI